VVQTLEVGVPEAIDDNLQEKALIYPNPAGDLIFVKCGSIVPMTFHIVNLTGQRVISKTLVSDYESIDISGLSNGIYMVELDDKRFKIVVE